MDWKKEIKLGDLVGRKSSGGADVAEPSEGLTVEQPATEQRTSLWKREFRVGKPKHEPAKTERLGLSRFAATPSADDTPPEASTQPAEERRGRFSRFARAGAPAPAGEEAREAPEAPAERKPKPSRFARPRKARDAASKPSGPTSSTHRPGKKGNLVGLKIGASHIAAAQVTSNGQHELVQFAREPLPKGIVVAGEVRDPDALAVQLKEFFSKHKLPHRNVRLGVGTNRVGVRRFEISGLSDPSHLENAIRFRAQEVLPIPLEEAVLDYQVVGETTDENGKKVYRVLLVVAYRDLVQRYVVACRAAGVKLVGIDFEAFALLRSLGPIGESAANDAAVVVVSIGHDRSTFVVADGSTCEFARVLDWGGGALDVAVARTLDLTPSQAEPIKQSLTLNATQERLEGYTDEQASAVHEAVRKELQTFVRELVSSLHFYQNQPGSLGIGEITITGGTAQLPGLAAELQRLVGVTVRVGDPFARVKSDTRLDSHAEMGSLAVAIGLGMEV